MAQINRNALKAYFKAGDKPTESQFGDFIDSSVNHADDNFVKSVNGLTGTVTLPATAYERNLIDWKGEWQEGLTSTPFFNRNGNANENLIVQGDNPFGHNVLLWRCKDMDTASNSEGGWNTDYFSIDRNRAYRFATWVKRMNNMDGTTYHGTQNVNYLNGVANNNPYFWFGDLPTLNEWYLMVGVVHAQNYAPTTNSGISGIYDKYGLKVLEGRDYKWRVDTTTTRLRDYLYYATGLSVEQFFWNPMVHVLDGTEPPLHTLFMSGLDTGWRTPSLYRNIVSYGTGDAAPRYKRVGKIVYIEGLVKGGTGIQNGDSVAIFVLPARFRPPKRVLLTSMSNVGVGRVDINPDGTVYHQNYGLAWTSLSGLCFSVE